MESGFSLFGVVVSSKNAVHFPGIIGGKSGATM